MPMLQIAELLDKVYEDNQTDLERLDLVRQAINILYNSADYTIVDDKLREQYEAYLTDPRRC